MINFNGDLAFNIGQSSILNMIVKEQEDNLKTFFGSLDRISNQGLYDLGLITKTKEQKTEELAKFVPKNIKVEIFKFSSKLVADDLLKFIIKVFEEKKWGLIELEDGFLPAKAYNQLRLLSINNHLQVFDLADKKGEEADIKQPKESRLIIVGNEEVLSKIKIPTFLRLFGPIINLK